MQLEGFQPNDFISIRKQNEKKKKCKKAIRKPENIWKYSYWRGSMKSLKAYYEWTAKQENSADKWEIYDGNNFPLIWETNQKKKKFKLKILYNFVKSH